MKFNNKVKYTIRGTDLSLTYVAHDAKSVVLREDNGNLRTLSHEAAAESLLVDLPPVSERIEKFWEDMLASKARGQYGWDVNSSIERNLRNNHLYLGDMGNGYLKLK
jgi:hypothetical protein